MKRVEKILINYWSLFSLLVLYIICAPRTVQGLDTGELVTNAFHFRLIHPPGYPLYMWLYGGVTNIFSSSPFFSASLLTICFSLLSLFLIFKSFRSQDILLKNFMILSLGSSFLFWRYALLPDVFMLHLLLVGFISYEFFNKNEKSSTRIVRWWAISLCLHHTSLFLAPLVLFKVYGLDQKKWLKLFFIGIAILGIGYCSLFLCDLSGLTSWKETLSFSDLFHHLIRSDYGSFQLKANSISVSKIDIFAFVFQEIISQTFFFIFILLYSLYLLFKEKRGVQRSEFLYLATLLLYIGVFFSLTNIHPSKMGAEVLQRFLLMPIFMTAFIGVRLLSHLELTTLKKRVLIGIAVVLTFANVWIGQRENDYSENTIVEDWAYNRLSTFPSDANKKVILLPGSDTELFALYYVQDVLGYKPYIPILMPNLLFSLAYFERSTQRVLPRLKLSKDKFLKDKKIDLWEDLILKNLEDYDFSLITKKQKDPRFRMTHTRLGSIVSKGEGIEFIPSYLTLRHSKRMTLSLSQVYYSDFKLLSHYTYYPMAKSLALLDPRESEVHKAKVWLKRALEIFPYATPAARNLCALKETKYCTQFEVLKNYPSYY